MSVEVIRSEVGRKSVFTDKEGHKDSYGVGYRGDIFEALNHWYPEKQSGEVLFYYRENGSRGAIDFYHSWNVKIVTNGSQWLVEEGRIVKYLPEEKKVILRRESGQEVAVNGNFQGCEYQWVVSPNIPKRFGHN